MFWDSSADTSHTGITLAQQNQVCICQPVLLFLTATPSPIINFIQPLAAGPVSHCQPVSECSLWPCDAVLRGDMGSCKSSRIPARADALCQLLMRSWTCLRTAHLRHASSGSCLGNYYCSDCTAQGDSDPPLLLLDTTGKRVTTQIGGYHCIPL